MGNLVITVKLFLSINDYSELLLWLSRTCPKGPVRLLNHTVIQQFKINQSLSFSVSWEIVLITVVRIYQRLFRVLLFLSGTCQKYFVRIVNHTSISQFETNHHLSSQSDG